MMRARLVRLKNFGRELTVKGSERSQVDRCVFLVKHLLKIVAIIVVLSATEQDEQKARRKDPG